MKDHLRIGLGAIYHFVTRGDGRRSLFHDAGNYERFTERLSDEVSRSAEIVLAFCWMPNHVHAQFKTPELNWSGRKGRRRSDVCVSRPGNAPTPCPTYNPVSVDSVFEATASQYAVSADGHV